MPDRRLPLLFQKGLLAFRNWVSQKEHKNAITRNLEMQVLRGKRNI